MVSAGIEVGAAFQLMRGCSRHHRVIKDVARDVIERRLSVAELTGRQPRPPGPSPTPRQVVDRQDDPPGPRESPLLLDKARMSELIAPLPAVPTTPTTAPTTAPTAAPTTTPTTTPTSRPMRITIIDRHSLFADAISQVLQRQSYIVTTLDAAHAETSLPLLLTAGLRSAARLILLGQDLGPLGEGIRLIAPLANTGTTVILLTESTDRAQWGRALQQGARDVVHKASTLSQVVRTTHRVRDGLPLMSAVQRTALIAAARTEHEEVRDLQAHLDRLTHREQEVLGCLMEGRTAQDIARTDVVAVATVRSQVKAILYKLEVRSQIAAVGAAYRAAWHPPPA